MSASLYQFIPAAELAHHLRRDISSAKRRVYLRTMAFGDSGAIHDITQLLIGKAGELGPEVIRVALDPISYTRADADATRRAVINMRSAGIVVTHVGKAIDRWRPAVGRSHSKLWIIDDIAYVGGVNLTDESFGYHDYMFRVEDTTITERLLQTVQASETTHGSEDSRVQLDDTTTLLVDGGRRKSSIIMDTAVELVAGEVSRAWYLSQYAPGNRLAVALRQTNSTVMSNTPHSVSKAHYKLVFGYEMITKRRPANTYRGTRKIHAKCLVIQYHDGTYTALTGSHNYSDWGVRFGTQEIAIMSTDQLLCQQLVSYFDSVQ